MDTERYARQIMLAKIGREGQERLAASSVLVVGAGGLGSAVLPYLAGAGVGCIGIVDDDTVSLSNLQRQVLYCTPRIGKPKCREAAERLGALNPEIRIDEYEHRLSNENAAQLIAQYDLVVDCCDNYATRYLLDDACRDCGKPWVYGTIGEFRGQVSLLNGESGVQYRDLYPDREYMCGLPRKTAGVLGAVPGVVGTIQACETLKWIAGFGEHLDGILLNIDLLTMQFDKIRLS